MLLLLPRLPFHFCSSPFALFTCYFHSIKGVNKVNDVRKGRKRENGEKHGILIKMDKLTSSKCSAITSFNLQN